MREQHDQEPLTRPSMELGQSRVEIESMGRELQGAASVAHYSSDAAADRYSKPSAPTPDQWMRPQASKPEQPSEPSEPLQQAGRPVTFEAPGIPHQALPLSMSMQPPPGASPTTRRPASAVAAGRYSLAAGKIPSPDQIASARPMSALSARAPSPGQIASARPMSSRAHSAMQSASVPTARTDRPEANFQRHNKAKDIRAEVSNIRFSGGAGTVYSDYGFPTSRARSTPAGAHSAR